MVSGKDGHFTYPIRLFADSLERILRKTCKGKEEVQEDKEGKPWCLLFALEHLKVEVVESVGPSDMMEPSCVVRA